MAHRRITQAAWEELAGVTEWVPKLRKTETMPRRQVQTTLSSVALAVAVTASGRARAWGAEGDRLLALEPGAKLALISTWPDEVRTPAKAPWHYVNLRATDLRTTTRPRSSHRLWQLNLVLSTDRAWQNPTRHCRYPAAGMGACS